MGVGLHEFEVREQTTAYSSAVINIVQSGESRRRPAEYVKYRPSAPEVIIPVTLTGEVILLMGTAPIY